jgi:hypothetical protein
LEAHVGEKSSKLGVILLTVCLFLAASGGGNAAIAAEPSDELVFDPVLSLTGGCGTSEIDPLPDPGCPGGEHPPAGAFSLARSITTDPHGDIYVASYGSEVALGAEGRIDIFDQTGKFLTEIPDPSGPKNLAVDSKGNLYVFQFHPGEARQVERYEPSVYEPTAGKIKYESAPELVLETLSAFCGIGVDKSSDHLFVHFGGEVKEFSSAEDGNKPLESFGGSSINHVLFPQGLGLAVDSAKEQVYVSDRRSTSPNDYLIDVFELKAPHNLIRRIDGAATSPGQFKQEMSIAAGEATGNVFAYAGGQVVYELTDDGGLVEEVKFGIKEVFGPEIGVDNGGFSPNNGYLFVPSHQTGIGHSFAFGPRKVCSAEVISASFANVTQSEAELTGAIEPCGLETSFVFEVTTLQNFEANGFVGAQVANQGKLPAGSAPVPVSVALSGLAPGTGYLFRLSATNELGADKGEGEFSTYPPTAPVEPCPNDVFRSGFSALLPDCRAYELVTPPETNARAPRGVGVLGPYFATREASPSGDRLSFMTEGGTLPGSEGTGSLGGDAYLSKREATGWTTSAAGPSGSEAVSPLPGGVSPDQGYSFWSSGSEGSAAVGGKDTSYVRYPDGHSELVGRGSLQNDPGAEGKLITESGDHIIFNSGSSVTSAIQLEPDAPPNGTRAVYDRTADEVTHVISLLPGDETPKAGENAAYIGASLDGRGVGFTIGTTLYLRYNNEETFEIGNGVTFAGIAEGGARTFYLEGGKLWRFDAASGERTAFSSGTVTPVNVSADGTVAYLVSTKVLTSEPNPNGAKAGNGEENLYRSEEGAISFVGTVTNEDVTGEEPGFGLGRWAPHVVSYGEAAEDPSRSTPDGGILLFESRANLAAYDSGGQTEVYRYDVNADELVCLSCNPTGAPASGGATLQSTAFTLIDPQPLSLFGSVTNLRADGLRAFFQSPDRLVPTDTDGLQDVYEWEGQGVGSCNRPGGCVYLISSGQSARINYLYAVSDSGDDVFFLSSDLLVPADLEETASIYDAKVGGGFPEESASGCEGEGCRPVLPAPPSLITPESGVNAAAVKGKTCPKGKKKVRRHGKVVCVKKKHHQHHPRTAGKDKKGGHK